MPHDRIMIVEDEMIVARDIEGSLRALEYDVTALVTSGEEAIQRAGADDPDLILMDIQLHDKLDGIDAAIQIQQLYDIPVMFLTSYADSATLDRAKQAEPLGYLLKPFDDRELRVSLEMALSKARMRKKLRASEEKYLHLIENANDSIFISDVETRRFLDCNHAAAQRLGYTREELLTLKIEDIYIPQSEELLAKNIQELNSSGSIIFEHVHLHKNGSLIPVEISSRRIEYDNQSVFLSFVRDITCRKQAEASLREETTYVKLLQKIAETANRVASIDDALHTCLDEVCTLMNWPIGHVYLPANDETDELVASKLWYVQNEHQYEEFLEITKRTRFKSGIGLPGRVFSSKHPAWITDVTKDENFNRCKNQGDLGVKAAFGFPVMIGEEVIAVLEFYADEAAEPDDKLLDVMGNIGVQLGRVEERLRAEAAIQEKDKRFRLAFDNANVGMALVSLKGNYIQANDQLSKMFGYSSQELEGLSVAELTHPDDQAKTADWYENALTGKAASINMEKRYLHKNGQIIWGMLAASLVRDDDGNPLYFVAQLQDITERKLAESTLQERIKEVNCLYNITRIAQRPGITIPDLLQETVKLLPEACQYPEVASVKIECQSIVFASPDYRSGIRKMSSDIMQDGERIGNLCLSYCEERPQQYEGPFLLEERRLINAVAERLGETIQRKQTENELRKLQDDMEDRVEIRTAELQQANAILITEVQERKRADEALRESEERFRFLFHASQDCVIILDRNLDYLYANPAANTYLGDNRGNIEGKNIREVMQDFPEMLQLWRRRLTAFFQSGGPTQVADSVRIFENIAYSESSLAPIKDASGKIVAVGIVYRDITDRRNAELAVQKNEERFRTVADFTYNWEYWIGNNGEFLYISPSCERITGYTAADYLHDNQLLLKIIYPEDQELVQRHLQKDLLSNATHTLEFRIITRDGNVRWLEHICQPVYSQDGRYIGRRASNRDITERKNSDIALRNLVAGTASVTGEEFFPALVRYVAAALNVRYAYVAEFDNNRYTRAHMTAFWANDKLINNYSYQLKGTPCVDVLKQKFMYCQQGVQKQYPAREWLRQANIEGYAGVTLTAPDGTVLGLLAVMDGKPLADQARTQPIMQVFAARAATEILRLRAEVKLQESEARFAGIVEMASEGIIAIDAKSRAIIVYNHGAERIFEYSAEEMIGQNIAHLLPRKHTRQHKHLYNIFQRYLDTDGHSVLQEETSIISRNGQEIPIDISISGFEQNGKFIHMAVIRDITQRKHLEKAKYLAEKTSRLASIGVMAAGITHEINQPLNAIRVTSDSMVLWDKRNEGIIPLPLVDQLKLISSGARRIDEIIQHMRSFWVTPDREVRETFSLDSTVQEALSLIDRQLHTHMIESVVELNSRNFTMVGNRIHLEQIVINLVTNALQALDSQSTKGKQIWVTSHRDDGMAVLEVADNGPGLPDVATESLFDPFYSTKRHKAGTGLGLAIVQRYVEAQKGVISARNRDGGGAIFTITFPVEQKA